MLSPRMRGVISCIASLLVSRSLSVSFVSRSFVSLVDAQGPDLYTKGATGNIVSDMASKRLALAIGAARGAAA